MIQPATWKAIAEYSGKVWAVVGPLVGVLIGGWISRATQRKHWVMDNKRAEYRKLLNTLSDSSSKCLIAYGKHAEGRDLRLAHEAIRSCTDVIYNRLFIAANVQDLDVMTRWTNLVNALAKDRDLTTFQTLLDKLMADIRQAAAVDLS